jgi:UDP-3-O-[3-hydroxymyristoyl] glucosamine N-acyltransferase
VNLSIKRLDILKLFPEAIVSGDSPIDHIKGLANLKDAQEGDLSFLGNPKYKSQVKDCKATIILLPAEYQGTPSSHQIYLKVSSPSLGLAKICEFIDQKISPPIKPGVHPTAFVETDATISPSATIGAFSYVGNEANVGPHARIGTHCHIGAHAEIGESSILYPGVKLLARCKIGKMVVLNAGVVIGSEGFGFDQDGEEHKKIPHIGLVVVEDGVEIGANTCIDRARFEATRIGIGSKLDNLVQIGHNVQIGKHCLIVSQVGISGSVIMEDDVVVGGQAGFAGHLRIGKGAKIAGQAGITKDVKPGEFLKGNPALPFQTAQRIAILQRKLPDLFNRFAEEKPKE